MRTIHALKPVLVTAPAETPLTLAEVKAHLRVDHTDEDSTIQIYLDGAIAHMDGWSGILGRCLVTQTWRLDMRRFPSGVLRLPLPDVQSATVAYTDTDGDAQTFTSFALAEDYFGAALVLDDGASWPWADDLSDAVQVSFVCGYGAASAVPSAIKGALLLHIGTMYENRATLSEKVSPNMAYEALTAPYRRVGF